MRKSFAVEPRKLHVGDIELSSRYGCTLELACMLRLMDILLRSDRAIMNVLRRVYCDTPHDAVWVRVRPVHHCIIHDDFAFRMGNRIAALIWAFDGPGNVFLEDETQPGKSWSFVKQDDDE